MAFPTTVNSQVTDSITRDPDGSENAAPSPEEPRPSAEPEGPGGDERDPDS
jgi:hypothetical protein